VEGGGDSVVGLKICLVVVCCPEVHEGCPGIKERDARFHDGCIWHTNSYIFGVWVGTH